MDRLRLETLRRAEGDDRAALTAMVNGIEGVEMVPLRAHRDTAAKLRFRRRSVSVISWELHESLRLPEIHTYAELVDALFHALRTLNDHRSIKQHTTPRGAT